MGLRRLCLRAACDVLTRKTAKTKRGPIPGGSGNRALLARSRCPAGYSARGVMPGLALLSRSGDDKSVLLAEILDANVLGLKLLFLKIFFAELNGLEECLAGGVEQERTRTHEDH